MVNKAEVLAGVVHILTGHMPKSLEEDSEMVSDAASASHVRLQHEHGRLHQKRFETDSGVLRGLPQEVPRPKIVKRTQMKNITPLSIVLFAATCFAQTEALPKTLPPDEPTPTGVPLKTWQINEQFSVQYDPSIFVLATETANGDKAPQLYPLFTDAKGVQQHRLDAMLRVLVVTNPNHTFTEMVEHAYKGIISREGIVPLEFGEFPGHTEKAVFFAYMQTFKDDQRVYAVNTYVFAGTTNDPNCHTAVIFEGMFPAEEIGSGKEYDRTLLGQMDTVVKTFNIKVLVPNKPVPLPERK